MSSVRAAVDPLLSRAGRRIAALVGKPAFWVAFVLIGMALPIARTVAIELPPPLPVLGTLPEFTFKNQYGEDYGTAQLKGRLWVANFIFTRCPTACPRFTKQMFTLQHRGRGLGQAFHLVSFSVDPEYDTPEVLLDFAQQNRVSPRAWTFLTGELGSIKDIVVNGLKVYMENAPGLEDDLNAIMHGTHFVLVDDQMRIRGYYDSNEEDAVDRLLRDAGLLANRGY
jgi:protein SCO1/2